MISLNNFRIALVTLALIVGCHALATSFVEWEAPSRPAFPGDPAKISASVAGEVPGWLQVVSLFRPDLESNQALIDALQAVKSGKERLAADTSVSAQARVKKALSNTPYDPELWLALALLQAQRDPRDPTFSEALKMSYFVAPNEMKLMPVRLDTATLFDALTDPDLKELARGDVRLMVTRKPELRTAVISAHKRASSVGKAFLEEAVGEIDPSFLPSLRG